MKWLHSSVKKVHRRIPPDAFKLVRELSPLLLLLALLVYLLIGASAFLLFEHVNNENHIKRFHLRLGAGRKQASRDITNSLFNQTANMLVIVDKVNQARMEDYLYRYLKVYEGQLPLKRPHEEAWSFTNSLTYSWGLLVTMGHGNRAPKTVGGQIFALFYAMIGVPLFMATVITCACSTITFIKWIFRKRITDRNLTENHLLFATISVYIWFVLGFSIILYSSAIPESYFRSLYTAVLSSFTIQTADYNDFVEFDKVLTLGCTGISLYLSALVLLTALGVYKTRGEKRKFTNSHDPVHEDEIKQIDEVDDTLVHVVHAEQVVGSSTPQPAPRFQVIVDECGESQLSKPKKKTTFVKEVHHY